MPAEKWKRAKTASRPAFRHASFYERAAALIDDLDAKIGSLRSLASKHEQRGDAKRLLALCIESLKVIEELVEKARLLKREGSALARADGPSTANHALVLVHDALFGKRGIELAKEDAVKKAIERQLPFLRTEKAKLMARRGATTDKELKLDQPTPSQAKRQTDDVDDAAPSRIRWLRVNTLRWAVEDALEWLESHGTTRVQSIYGLEDQTYAVDEYLPVLLAFPASLKLESLAPYRDGRLIAQDKASCFPAWLLAANVNTPISAIDATAAPGNKTTMLAALLQPHEGKITAFERDPLRYQTLKQMLKKAGASVRATQGDFLAVDPADPAYGDVTHFLVDPSCSGSGIVSRLDALSSNGVDEQRIRSLSAFQTTILSHAMRFTSAQRIVYSTCSLHEQENEQVVARVLRKPEFSDWSVATDALPTWTRRGVNGYRA